MSRSRRRMRIRRTLQVARARRLSWPDHARRSRLPSFTWNMDWVAKSTSRSRTSVVIPLFHVKHEGRDPSGQGSRVLNDETPQPWCLVRSAVELRESWSDRTSRAIHGPFSSPEAPMACSLMLLCPSPRKLTPRPPDTKPLLHPLGVRACPPASRVPGSEEPGPARAGPERVAAQRHFQGFRLASQQDSVPVVQAPTRTPSRVSHGRHQPRSPRRRSPTGSTSAAAFSDPGPYPPAPFRGLAGPQPAADQRFLHTKAAHQVETRIPHRDHRRLEPRVVSSGFDPSGSGPCRSLPALGSQALSVPGSEQGPRHQPRRARGHARHPPRTRGHARHPPGHSYRAAVP